MEVDVMGTTDRLLVTTRDGQKLVVQGPVTVEDYTKPRIVVGSDRYPIDPKTYARLGATRVYSDGDPPSLANVPAEAMPICSWKNITDPAKFTPWANGRARKVTRLHEMDRDPTKGGPTPDAWHAESAAIEQLIVKHPNAANLEQIEIFTGYASRHKPARSWDKFYTKSTVPGRVKVMGFDLEVDRTSWPKGYPPVEPFMEVMLYAARDAGVPVWATEYGWPREDDDLDGSEQAAFYQDSYDYAEEQTIAVVAGILVYDYAKGSTGDYLLRGPALVGQQKRMAAQFA